MTAVSAVSRPRSSFLTLLLILALSLLSACQRAGEPADTTELAAIGVYSAALSPDARFAVAGSLHHGGSLWRLRDGERLFDWNHQPGEQTNIIAAGFSPDTRFALTASHQTMVLWNVDSGEPVTYWTAPAEVMDLALPPGARFALLGLANYSAVLFDVQRGGILQTVHHDNEVLSVALDETGEVALTGDEAGTALLWDTDSGAQLQRWQHADEVVTVALSPDGNRALTVAKYDRAAIWDTASGELLWELPLRATAIKRGKSFTSARFSANGRQLLTGNSEELVQLWDVGAKTELARWRLPKRDTLKPGGSPVVALAFGPRGDYYAIGSAGRAHRLTR